MKSKWEKLSKKAGEYSDKDYAEADRAARLEKRIHGDVLRRKNLGDKSLLMDEAEIETIANDVRNRYLLGTEDKKQKKINAENDNFTRKVDLPKANSIEQYKHERDAGDPNALNLSFEDWKKL